MEVDQLPDGDIQDLSESSEGAFWMPNEMHQCDVSRLRTDETEPSRKSRRTDEIRVASSQEWLEAAREVCAQQHTASLILSSLFGV